MKSILVTYPDFRSLPKGIKRMLVTSESLFFEAATSASDPSACHDDRVTSGSHDPAHWAHVWALPDWTTVNAAKLNPL